MKKLKNLKNILRSNKTYLYEKYGVKTIYLFGSLARGEEDKTSDLDVIVDLEKPVGLKFIELAEYLKEITGVEVDVLTFPMIEKNIYLKKQIEKDLFRV